MKHNGYTNSQTWEAWRDSFNVFWDNTEIVFLISVTLSLGAVIYTWLYYPKSNCSQFDDKECKELNNTTMSTIVDEDIVEEREFDRVFGAVGSAISNQILNDKELLKKDPKPSLSLEEKKKEREEQAKQLQAIYKLMYQQKEKFGDTSIDDIKDQMKLYCR